MPEAGFHFAHPWLLLLLLAKLVNLVPDGGIWMNTQRPEWNDANNALVGNGLSMVTLFHLRRYLLHLRSLVDGRSDDPSVSTEVVRWFDAVSEALAAEPVGDGPDADRRRRDGAGGVQFPVSVPLDVCRHD